MKEQDKPKEANKTVLVIMGLISAYIFYLFFPELALMAIVVMLVLLFGIR